MGKKGTSGGGTVRTRKDGSKEARLLVPREYRAVVGRTYLYFYGKTEREAKDKKSAALSDLIQRDRGFLMHAVSPSESGWSAGSTLYPARWHRTRKASTSTALAPT